MQSPVALDETKLPCLLLLLSRWAGCCLRRGVTWSGAVFSSSSRCCCCSFSSPSSSTCSFSSCFRQVPRVLVLLLSFSVQLFVLFPYPLGGGHFVFSSTFLFCFPASSFRVFLFPSLSARHFIALLFSCHFLSLPSSHIISFPSPFPHHVLSPFSILDISFPFLCLHFLLTFPL